MAKKGNSRTRISTYVYNEQALYLKGLKALGLKMTDFIKLAINYYIPIHMEKLEVLLRYKKAMKNYSPIMNEEKEED